MQNGNDDVQMSSVIIFPLFHLWVCLQHRLCNKKCGRQVQPTRYAPANL